MKKTRIISGFPGVGKTYFYNNTGLEVLDSDSSKFSKLEDGRRNIHFPENYIHHIKQNIGKVDIILASTHKEVRDALIEASIEFTLVYPGIILCAEYLNRFEQRGSPLGFVNLISNNWIDWLGELHECDACNEHIILGPGQFLTDVI